jgi:hypothetical protein
MRWHRFWGGGIWMNICGRPFNYESLNLVRASLVVMSLPTDIESLMFMSSSY